MQTFRYVVADVFTDTPLGGQPARGLHRRPRRSTTRRCRRSRSRSGSARRCSCTRPRTAATSRSASSRRRSSCRSPGHPTLGTAFVLGAPLQLDVITLETGRGNVPVRLERDESGRIVFGRMEQPVPTIEPHPDPQAVLRRARRGRLGAAGRALRQRRHASLRRGRLRGRGGGTAAERRGDQRARRHGRELLRGLGRQLDAADVLGAWRGRRHGLGGRPARLPPRAPRPDRLGRRDRRSRRVPRSGVPRRCTREPRAAQG